MPKSIVKYAAMAVLSGLIAGSPAIAQSLLPARAPASAATLSLEAGANGTGDTGPGAAGGGMAGLGEGTILSTRPMSLARAAAARDHLLIAFEQPKSALTLEGEDDAVQLSFMLDKAILPAGGDLVIAYRNAVSVMPEASVLSVTVNGTPIGEFAIRSPSGFDRQRLAISPALLRPGLNQVRLRAVQRHRVDCSMEATYELWTEIDPHLSGFRPYRANRPNDFANLRTIGRNDDGLTDLRLVLPENAGAEALNRAAPLVQTMALALNRDDILVSVAETPGSGPGIDLVVVTDEAPAASGSGSINPADMRSSAPPYGLSVSVGADPRRAKVSLRTATSREIPGMLLTAIEGPLKDLLDNGVRAKRNGEIRAEASSAYTLADAGYVASPFSGRLFRSSFEMVLPADFYPAEYATMDLALHAATSPGLKPTSQLLVRVNGHIVKSLPMRDANGEVFSGRLMELPLRAFRPGRNQIEVLAELERRADESCLFAERDETTPRFILLDTTEIRVPELARVARLPELAAMAGSAYPYAGSAGVDVHALKPDAHSISTALTMIAKMSLAAGAPVPARVAFGPPAADHRGNALVIAPKRAMEDLARLGPATFPQAPARINFAYDYTLTDPISTASINLPGAALPIAMTTDPVALLDAFRQTTRNLGDGANTVESLGDMINDGFRSFRHWLNYERPSDVAPLVEPRRKAVLSQRPGVSGDGVVTWLTADSPLDMIDASTMLADPSVWNRLEGENVVLDLDKRSIRTMRPEGYFSHELKDYGPGNLRRVAAAWFSDHFRIYVALVIGLMAVFAIWLGRAVPKAGVRTDR
jgi:hypothetical protein